MIAMQQYRLNRAAREGRNKHRAFVVWLTGLSGAGKSTLADMLEQYLFEMGLNVYVLDGDNIRTGINKDLDFSKEGRKENIRRVAEVAKLFCDAGVIVITAFISPYAEDRKMARDIIGADDFIEVFVDASLECCIKRDVKGLYAKALAGEISLFTGITDLYEPPAAPDIYLNTEDNDVTQCLSELIKNINIPATYELPG